MCVTQYCFCTPYITTSVVMCLSKCCCHCWINCLKVQNNTWTNFVSGEPKIKNYTDANRILWHDKNAAWVFEWVYCFKNEKKSTEKRSSSPVWCQMTENSICEMEIYGPHQTILNDDIKMWYKFVPKLPTDIQKEKCCLWFSTFLHMWKSMKIL